MLVIIGMMKEEQKKRYTEDKKIRKGSMTVARGSLGHIQTIYTGSDPPGTLGSTGPSISPHRPDSGFRSRTRSPLEPSSSEHSADSHHRQWRQNGHGRAKNLHNDQASDFDDPRVIGSQKQSQRKHYPPINSVVKSKSHSPPSHSEGESEEDGTCLQGLPYFSQSEKEEEKGTSGCDTCMFVVGGRTIVQRRNPCLSDIQEDDQHYSDTERDGAVLPPQVPRAVAADHENIHSSRHPESPDEHRTLTQVNDGPCSNQPHSRVLRIHKIDVNPRQHAAKSDASSMQSSPPISIPSRKIMSALKPKITPEQKSCVSSSSEQSSDTTTSSLADGDSDNGQSAHSSVASQPKVLQHPSKWRRLKEYIMSSVQEAEHDQTAASTPGLGLRML